MFANNAPAQNPALRLIELYDEEVKNNRTINPYIVTIIAINEISGQRHLSEVKEYILWYFKHLNYPDHDGLTGTIYDYEITETGEERSTGDYDSVDGYAGIFLYLLNLYYSTTGDRELIDGHMEKIKDIAYLIHYLQDTDGLTRESLEGKDNVKYLMDNCESYAGIRAFNNLAEKAFPGDESLYRETENKIINAVNEKLYNAEMKNYYWAVDDNVRHISNWNKLYPDSIAQLFPIYFGLLDEDRGKRKELWNRFNKKYGAKAAGFPLEQRIIYKLTKKRMKN